MLTIASALHTALVLLLFVYTGHAGALCLGLERGVLRRWTAACLIAPGVLVATFNVLAVVGGFGATSATLSLAGIALALHLTSRRLGAPSVGALLEADRTRLARLAAPLMRGSQGIVTLGLVLLAALGVGRAMAHPPLAWDALTYHAVKPVLWLQSGGALVLEAPGGWSTHAGRLAGADVVTAWAMLAGPGDTVWGAADVFWWFALAVSLIFMSSELGLRVRERIAVAVYACCVPVTFLSVGSGYAELPVAACTCAVLGLLIHAHRNGHAGAWVAGMIGIGLLMSMKLIVWPAVAVLGAFAAAIAMRSRSTGTRDEARAPLLDAPPIDAMSFAVGVTFAALIALPGLVRTWFETGYPLSVPLALGPLTLGPPNAEIGWLEATLPSALSHGWTAELAALGSAFGSPLRAEPQFTWLTLPLLALAVVGAARTLRRGGAERTRMLWLSAALAAVLAGWFSPSLETVRLHWAPSNARHFMPVVLPLIPLVFAGVRGVRPLEALAPTLLIGLGGLYALGLVIAGWSQGSYVHATTAASIALLLFVFAPIGEAGWRRASGRGAAPAWALTLAVGIAVTGVALVAHQESSRIERFARLQTHSAFGVTPKYWFEAVALVDRPDAPTTIAVTSGPLPTADGWFMYPLFGRDHQNRLVHARVTDSAAPLPLAPGYGRTQRARFELWWQQLAEHEADYVMAFHPTTLELGWMRARQDRFTRLAGDRKSWGLYRIERGAPGD